MANVDPNWRPWMHAAARKIAAQVRTGEIRRLADLGARVGKCTMDEAMASHIVGVMLAHVCGACEEEEPEVCETCDGDGTVRMRSDIVIDRGVRPRESDYEYLIEECPDCHGKKFKNVS